MNRIAALLLPLVMLTTGALRPSAPVKASPPDLAKAWSASISAESSANIDEAAAQLAIFSRGGGDPYLAELRAGWLDYSKGSLQSAGEHYSRAAKLQTGAIAPLSGMLNAALGLNDAKKITAAAESVLRVEPTNYTALMALANVAYASRDHRKAFLSYRRTLVTYPGDLAALSGASWSALSMGDKRVAHDGFTLILSLSTDYPLAQRGFDLSTEGVATR